MAKKIRKKAKAKAKKSGPKRKARAKAPDLAKILILVRHAHRDKPMGGILDNGLSEKGRRQAKRVRERFEAELGGSARAYLVSSPKARCRETLEPLSQLLGTEIAINEMLNEGEPVIQKVRSFLEWWRLKGPSLTVICSHGDWLPVCIGELTGVPYELAKGGWAELRLGVFDEP
jgi:8-oxo-dGTP diphosphatase